MRVLKDEKGAVLIMVSFMIVVALFVAAIVLDLGRAWVVQARLQAAADAATLAAIRQAKTDAVVVYEPEYETRTRRVPRYDGDGNLIGYETEEYRVEVGKKERAVGQEIALSDLEANAEATGMLLKNAAAWNEKDYDGSPLMPVVTDAEVKPSPDKQRVTYRLKASMAVPSLLYGPLAAAITGDQDARYITVHAESESSVSLSR